MKAKVKHLHKLLDAVCEKAGSTKDFAGLKECGAKIHSSIKEDYLYKNILNPIKQKDYTDSIGVGINQLNTIVKYLGYKSYNDFVSVLEQPIEPQLLSCVGNYYSYVGRNTDERVILKSPVRIQVKDGRICFELKGPKWNYIGDVQLANNCFFILMKAKGEKSFYHVYKIGKRETPSVLQGIFSGVSTALEPIGGRTVLIRTEEEFDNMTNEELRVNNLRKSKSKELRRLAEYFSSYEENNLRIKSVVTFTIDDLGNVK